jgi:hypothetical protein
MKAFDAGTYNDVMSTRESRDMNVILIMIVIYIIAVVIILKFS